MSKEEKKYNNHTRNQRRMFRIKKQEEKINDLKLLVGNLQSQLEQQLYQLQQDNENLRTTIKNDDIAINNLCNEIRQLKQDKEDKYKNAWEYMFEWFNKKNVKRDTPKSLEIENFVIEFMQEIEKMNGIEVK